MPKQSNYKPLSPIAIDYAQDLSAFGRNVRKYREQQELTLDDLAALLNSDKAAVSRIENGERNPKLETVLKIADALRTTPAKLCPNRFLDAEEAGVLLQIYNQLMKLPVEKRETTINYISAMLKGLLLQDDGSAYSG